MPLDTFRTRQPFDLDALLGNYPGPRPGTPEFQAAIAAGQQPIRDWYEQQRAGRLQQGTRRPPDSGVYGGTSPLGVQDPPHVMSGYGALPALGEAPPRPPRLRR